MRSKPSNTAVLTVGENHASPAVATTGGRDSLSAQLPVEALDDRIAIIGTAGSGKTYTAKGFVEQLLDGGARVTIVDPLGVWWGLRASADGSAAGYPVVVFGGNHADVAITAEMGSALGRMIATEALVCVVDLSELGSSAARRRFMAAFSEALYEANEEPLHLVLDEADLWAPQRPHSAVLTAIPTSACATFSQDGTKWQGAAPAGSLTTLSMGNSVCCASNACHSLPRRVPCGEASRRAGLRKSGPPVR